MSVQLMQEALNEKSWEAADTLWQAMRDRNLRELQTSTGTLRLRAVRSSCSMEETLTFNGSGDLFSSISMEGTVRYLNGDYNSPIEHPTPTQVAHLIESWDSILDAIHDHDRRVSDVASTDLRDIEKP